MTHTPAPLVGAIKPGMLALAMLASGSSLAEGPNLITNGGFETGDLTGWTTSYFDFSTIGDLAVGEGGFPTDGDWYRTLRSGASPATSSLRQPLAGQAGHTYHYSVDLAYTGDTPSHFSMAWDNQFIVYLIDPQPFALTRFEGTFTLVTDPSEFRISFFTPYDIGTRYNYYSIDRIIIAEVPEAQTWAMLAAGLLTLPLARRRQPAS